MRVERDDDHDGPSEDHWSRARAAMREEGKTVDIVDWILKRTSSDAPPLDYDAATCDSIVVCAAFVRSEIPSEETPRPDGLAGRLYDLAGVEPGESEKVDELVRIAVDENLSYEERKQAEEKLERRARSRRIREDKRTQVIGNEDMLERMSWDVDDRHRRKKLFGPAFQDRSGGRVRKGRQRKSEPALVTTSEAGKRWENLGGDEHATRDFLASRAADLDALCLPFGRGRLSAAEQQRYDELARLAAAAREAGALLTTIGAATGRSRAVIHALVQRGTELAGDGANP